MLIQNIKFDHILNHARLSRGLYDFESIVKVDSDRDVFYSIFITPYN